MPLRLPPPSPRPAYKTATSFTVDSQKKGFFD